MWSKIRYYWQICWGFSSIELRAYPLLLLSLICFDCYQKWRLNSNPVEELSLSQPIMDSLLAQKQQHTAVEDNRFRFNPNLIGQDSLILWGLPAQLAANWNKYQAAGGSFNSAQDLKKLYGMSDSIWQHLQECLDFSGVSKYQQPQQPTIALRDLNAADSIELQQVYGIGPVLSRRIVRYRDLLGGFSSIKQLSEVYGLDSLVLSRLYKRYSLKEGSIYHKLDINTFDYKSLVRHPYLNARQVSAIMAYREQHGAFLEPEQLKAVHLIDDSTYIKLYPYLDF